MITVDEETRTVLARCTTDGMALALPPEPLPRPLYVKVNKVLVALGGRWDRKAAAHLFDPSQIPSAAEALAQALSSEQVQSKQQADGWFATPPNVVAQVVEEAGLHPGMRVLEPSAGAGALARPVLAAGCLVDCVEIDPHRAALLQSAGPWPVTVADFLTLPPSPIYDRVVMNPPFAKRADVRHILHAWQFLRPGGRLVSVAGAGVVFRQDRATEAVRSIADVGGQIITLPPEAFKEAGTTFSTVLVVANKPLGNWHGISRVTGHVPADCPGREMCDYAPASGQLF